MRYPVLMGCTLAAAAAVLVGCSDTGLHAPPSTPQNVGPQLRQGIPIAARLLTTDRAVGSALHRHVSDVRGTGAVYVSDYLNNVLLGYPLTGGSPTYTATSGLSSPEGLASAAKNVYVANTGGSAVLVFTPPSTTPTATILDPGEYPTGVAVNKTGSQIWVANICDIQGSCGVGNLQEYKSSAKLTQTIACSDLYNYYFVAIDAKGNVAVDGVDAHNIAHVDFVPVGSSTCTPLSRISFSFPGGLAFTSKGDLAIDDQDADMVTTWAAPKFRKRLSTTALGGGIDDPVTFAFGRGDAILWTANSKSVNATQFAYPAGGSPIVTISSGLAEPIGVAVLGKT